MKESGLSRVAYAILFTVTLATAVGNLGLVAVMPAIGRALKIPDALVACIFSLSALAYAFTAPVWASVSDRRGRKPMILLGLAGFGGSMIGCGFVVLAGMHQLATGIALGIAFAVIRSSYGLFGSAAGTASQAYIADHSHGHARVRALSGLAGALSIGTIIGPALSPLLIIEPMGLAGPMFIFGLFAAILFCLVTFCLSSGKGISATPASGSPPSKLWHDPVLRRLMIQGLTVASAQAVNTYTLGFAILDSTHRPPTQAQSLIGIAMSIGAASGLVAQLGLVNILKPSPAAMLRWGVLLVAVGNGLIIAVGGIPVLLAGFAIACFGYGLARPGFSAGLSLAVGADRQGAVAGAVNAIAGASIALPPIIAIACYQLWWGAPFFIAAAGCAFVFVDIVRKRPPVFPVSD
ncbi:MAG: MFS transporter [Sphingomonadales bacterium]